MNNTIKIFFTLEAYMRIQALVEASSVECSMLGEVEKRDGKMVVTKIYVPKQTRYAAYTEITDEGVLDLLSKPDVKPHLLKAWFHSHVNMGVFASAKDESQIKELMDDNEWFIRGIFNKKGEVNLSLHILGMNFPAEVSFWLPNKEGIEEAKAELEEMTVTKTISYQYPASRGSNNYEFPSRYGSKSYYYDDDYYQKYLESSKGGGGSKKSKKKEMDEEYDKFTEDNKFIRYAVFRLWYKNKDIVESYAEWKALFCVLDNASFGDLADAYEKYLSQALTDIAKIDNDLVKSSEEDQSVLIIEG